MGNTKSTCRVANHSQHEISVAVYSQKDVSGEFAKQRVLLQPGQTSKKLKGLLLRVSGHGKVEDLQLARPGETVVVQKVRRGKQAQPDAPAALPVEEPQELEQQPPEPVELEAKQRPSKKAPRSTMTSREEDAQRVRSWLDEKDKYTRDELSQLVVKLHKEEVKEQRDDIMRQIKEKAAQSEAPGSRDELSAQIAALQRRNQPSAAEGQAKEQASEEPALTINTDTGSDDLMAAINRFSRAKYPAKRSWDAREQPHQIWAHA